MKKQNGSLLCLMCALWRYYFIVCRVRTNTRNQIQINKKRAMWNGLDMRKILVKCFVAKCDTTNTLAKRVQKKESF